MWKWSDLKRIFMRKASMRDTADLGAVMWPAAYPAMDPEHMPRDPHVTVVIFTDINNPDLGYTREDVMDVVRETSWSTMLWCKTNGIEWFGENQDIPVLRVYHDMLEAYRNDLVQRLAKRGIPIDLKFPEYKPHITIPDAAALDEVYPQSVLVGPVEVWWGNEHYKMGNDL